MSKCRACGTVRTKGDPCPSADCPKNTAVTVRIKGRSLPMTVGVKHGYHGLNTTMSLVSDYDAPISARSRWRRAS